MEILKKHDPIKVQLLDWPITVNTTLHPKSKEAKSTNPPVTFIAYSPFMKSQVLKLISKGCQVVLRSVPEDEIQDGEWLEDIDQKGIKINIH